MAVPSQQAESATRNSNYSKNGQPIVDGCQCQACAEVLRSVLIWAERPEPGRMSGARFLSKRRRGGRVMTKTLATLAVGATAAIGAVASPTAADARWRHHGFPIPPLVGGLAAGAPLGGALGGPRNSHEYAH